FSSASAGNARSGRTSNTRMERGYQILPDTPRYNQIACYGRTLTMDRMRYVAACLSMLCSFGALAGPNAVPSSVTIVYRFAGPYSEKSVDEMKREMGSIMKGSGLQIDWRERGTLTDSASFNNLVVVEFRGKCVME